MENQNFTKKQWIIIIAILFCLSVFIGWRLYKYTHSDPNPEIAVTKSAKAKTEAQIEGNTVKQAELDSSHLSKSSIALKKAITIKNKAHEKHTKTPANISYDAKHDSLSVAMPIAE